MNVNSALGKKLKALIYLNFLKNLLQHFSLVSPVQDGDRTGEFLELLQVWTEKAKSNIEFAIKVFNT
ncbi:hypothetical protein [Nodularia sp. UHCC 0506]|uniref:hypothetical protein n=1 Tax=Nodularia sp. UHCC 0506 TaxID=3110243 RepID=UPI002B1FE724|nr:hypothetical protein [Nodularia sp. UHCC 0506]MEA5517066.1 hypothetical protein [Nodularia sp. UHCC 0506]